MHRWFSMCVWVWIGGNIAAVGVPPGDPPPPDERALMVDEAVAAATKWLQRVDAGEYHAAWEEAAAYLRDAVPRDQWHQSIRAARPPLGAVIRRTLHTTEYHATLPGAPDGQYVVIQFKTEFENKQKAVETVTPMREADGLWRVAGYFIR